MPYRLNSSHSSFCNPAQGRPNVLGLDLRYFGLQMRITNVVVRVVNQVKSEVFDGLHLQKKQGIYTGLSLGKGPKTQGVRTDKSRRIRGQRQVMITGLKVILKLNISRNK